jgi:hypothetical protein
LVGPHGPLEGARLGGSGGVVGLPLRLLQERDPRGPFLLLGCGGDGRLQIGVDRHLPRRDRTGRLVPLHRQREARLTGTGGLDHRLEDAVPEELVGHEALLAAVGVAQPGRHPAASDHLEARGIAGVGEVRHQRRVLSHHQGRVLHEQLEAALVDRHHQGWTLGLALSLLPVAAARTTVNSRHPVSPLSGRVLAVSWRKEGHGTGRPG